MPMGASADVGAMALVGQPLIYKQNSRCSLRSFAALARKRQKKGDVHRALETMSP